MHAYIDESGNTGDNLFDATQPYFLNVAMSSLVDFDDVFLDRIAGIARRAGVKWLHASELGAEGIETIAEDMTELVEFSQVRFYLAFVNKPDVAVIKFFDAVFDPGENPAAPHHSYVIRSLKFLLLLKFAALLTVDEAKSFWGAMVKPRTTESEAQAIGAIRSVLQRVDILPDARSQELIEDTLTWAKDNIGQFSFWNPRKQDRYGNLPNIFTFPALMTGIYESSKLWDTRVKKIIHDRQSQFEHTLRQWHSLFRGLEPERIVHFGDTPIEYPDIRDSQFEMGDSRVSPGLQVADVVLWTFSRMMTGKQLGPRARELFENCFSPRDVFIMSLDWIATEVDMTLSALNRRAITDDELKAGRKLMDRIEQQRQQRMREASSR